MLTRLRTGPLSNPDNRDVLLAAGVGVLSLLQVLWLLPIASRPVGVVVALGTAAPLAFRRSHPVAAATAGALVWLVPTNGYLLLGYLASFFLFYSVTAWSASNRRAAAGVGIGVALAVLAGVIHGEPVGEYAGALLAVLAPAGVGVLVRRQREQARRLEELTWHLERERERGAGAAVAEERARIARELHDVVSHGISVIAIESEVADVALDTDRERARSSLVTMRSSAREALAEMRRLLGVLREDDEEQANGLEPLPGLADLPALIDRVRATGQEVSLTVTGTPVDVSASVGLSAYRIVQEALTNVRKHAAGAAAAVSIACHTDAVVLKVSDSGPGPASNDPGGGHGLLGVRERVRLHGGHLQTGRGARGGFELQATLPLRERPAP
jgi:signal transduction histidine kinase